ncbi:NHLP leader peptide family RiPP precursor [Sporomusa malonica]|uniref:NHLP leader peptide domain-containing protein n=1 Tax=Sporomusa malonica TaxID=112901 RepID=A0A1W2BA56_9FIRM|nr:NHLP leader peptide family RiPP precursor [Sporomusa malonica]SMC69806.1 NHLP leader peptide domain-containing protein [Sporomusa malonica]
MNEQKKPTWKEFEAQLIAKAVTDETFRRELIQNPKKVVQQEIDKESGVKLPAELEVKVIEQPASTLVIVLPCIPVETLSHDELDQVAGGSVPNCNSGFAKNPPYCGLNPAWG